MNLQRLSFLASALILLGESAVFAQEQTIHLSVADAANRRFYAAGPDGERFILEWSTNLLHWKVAATNYLYGADAPVLIHQPAFPERTFYRARRYEPPQTCNCNETIAPGAGCPVYAPPDHPTNRNNAIPNSGTPVKTLRLLFHILAENDGSAPAVSNAQVEEQVQTLNDHFRPHRIQFIHQTSLLRHSTYRHPQSEGELVDLRRAYSASPATQLNIFITAMPGEKYGFSTYPWDPAALTAEGGIVSTLLRCGRDEALLTHEIGHALGLWHTHHGSDEAELNRCHECWERADSSTAAADRTGDRCSDTPPGNLTALGQPRGGLDPCSSNAWPIVGLNNFMSAYPATTDRFTPQQAGRMHAWINHALTGWLDHVTPAAPSGLVATNPPFGEVVLTWADNSWNETSFTIERATGAGVFAEIATVSANTTSFTDLTAPASVESRYRLRAFNGTTPSAYSAPAAITTSQAPVDFLVDYRNLTPPFTGTLDDPFRTVPQAYDAVTRPAVIRIQSGTYPQNFLLNGKILRLEPLNGPVLLGTP